MHLKDKKGVESRNISPKNQTKVFQTIQIKARLCSPDVQEQIHQNKIHPIMRPCVLLVGMEVKQYSL